ncbi:glycosyltransferase family 4 protein [Dyella caseinilytica]|uniref:Glycosyltransferase family 4 protein n=2 Tax=Dyella caseinilytica TaxID=1849581 RepID=A0ABX7H1V9_9GAMM|nr:glycosyltransferase family 4 protein [Dyella caseinilytica]
MADIPEAAASSGIRMSFIQAAGHTEQMTRQGIDYHFNDVSSLKAVIDRGHRFARLLNDIKADVLHVHGLGFPQDVFAIAHHLPQLPILFQDHADHVPRWWRRLHWRRWYRCAAGVAFTAADMAGPFMDAGVFAPSTPLFEVPESSSRFTLGDHHGARADTGLYGDPCIVWVGHLTPGKDPLTMLDGVARAASQRPGLQLWCAFGTSPLMDDVKRRIASDLRLHGRVHLLGNVPHARVERLMQAADVFVSASLSESCGYALLEAMACGALPVVTDIPAFRTLTGGGRIGELYPCGDPVKLAEALLRASHSRPKRAHIRAHFDEALSFHAVGRKWAGAYEHVLQHRGGIR